MRDDEPRPVWMSLLITHFVVCVCFMCFITAGRCGSCFSAQFVRPVRISRMTLLAVNPKTHTRLFDIAPLILRHERALAPPPRAELIDFFSRLSRTGERERDW